MQDCVAGTRHPVAWFLTDWFLDAVGQGAAGRRQIGPIE
jgi:hypothetical protein